MKSERRDTRRVKVTLETIVNFNGRDFRQATTRDISLDGVFVKAPGAKFRKGPAEIAIRLPTEAGDRFHRFSAQLVHNNAQGAGFTFDKVDTDAYAALLGLVFSREAREARRA